MAHNNMSIKLICEIKIYFFSVLQCWYGNYNNICCHRFSYSYCGYFYGCTEQDTPEKNEVKKWYVFYFNRSQKLF